MAEELTRAMEAKEEAEDERRRAIKESTASKQDALQLEKLVRILKNKLESRDDHRGVVGRGSGSDGGGGSGSGSVGSRSGGRGSGGSVDSGGFRSDSYDSGSESCGSRRGSIVSHASVTPATHL